MSPVSTQPVGIDASQVTVHIPSADEAFYLRYPNTVIELRRHDSNEWTRPEYMLSPVNSNNAILVGNFSDDLYYVRVSGVSADSSEYSAFTPAASFFTTGRGNYQCVCIWHVNSLVLQ